MPNLQIKISLPVFILMFLLPLTGGFLVLLSRDNILPDAFDVLVYPFDSSYIFYDQGQVTFHFVAICSIYLFFGALVYGVYKFILIIIDEIKLNKKQNDHRQ